MKNRAFTLAEVLITLGIIGIVIAMTLPTIITKYTEAQTVAQLKKAYSTLQQAFLYAQEEEGPIENWDLVGFFSPEGAQNLINILTPHLKIIKNCSNETKNCIPNMYYYPDMQNYMNLNADTRTGKAVLADGTLFLVRTRGKHCDDTDDSYLEEGYDPRFEKYCAWILMDLNGMKKPNALGRDVFAFNVYSTGVYPSGLPKDRLPFEGTCKHIKPEGPMAGSRGFGCTAWVLYNENMDYLHCDDLSWESKRKCK